MGLDNLSLSGLDYVELLVLYLASVAAYIDVIKD